MTRFQTLYIIFLENTQGQTMYQRGCIRKPIDKTEPHCEKSQTTTAGIIESERCYCYEDECNGAKNLSVSFGLIGLFFMYFLM